MINSTIAFNLALHQKQQLIARSHDDYRFIHKAKRQKTNASPYFKAMNKLNFVYNSMNKTKKIAFRIYNVRGSNEKHSDRWCQTIVHSIYDYINLFTFKRRERTYGSMKQRQFGTFGCSRRGMSWVWTVQIVQNHCKCDLLLDLGEKQQQWEMLRTKRETEHTGFWLCF